MISSLKGLLSLGGLTPKELAARVWRAMSYDDIFNRAAILVGGEVNSEIERAAAVSGEKDAKLPGERSPGEKATAGGEVGGAQAA